MYVFQPDPRTTCRASPAKVEQSYLRTGQRETSHTRPARCLRRHRAHARRQLPRPMCVHSKQHPPAVCCISWYLGSACDTSVYYVWQDATCEWPRRHALTKTRQVLSCPGVACGSTLTSAMVDSLTVVHSFLGFFAANIMLVPPPSNDKLPYSVTLLLFAPPSFVRAT